MVLKMSNLLQKRLLGKFNLFEIILLFVVLASAIYNYCDAQNYTLNKSIGAISALLGVVCVVLGAKGSLSNWFFGIIECILHIYITCVDHFYGDALQRLLYNLPMQFAGLSSWKKKRRKDHEGQKTLKTRYMSWRERLITMSVVALSTIILTLFLYYYGNDFRNFLISVLGSFEIDVDFKTLKAAYPSQLTLWLDSFTTVSCIVAMFISVKAYVEQWYLWLLINIAYLVMWANNPNSDFQFMTLVKYSIYFVNTFYGIYMWRKLAKE